MSDDDDDGSPPPPAALRTAEDQQLQPSGAPSSGSPPSRNESGIDPMSTIVSPLHLDSGGSPIHLGRASPRCSLADGPNVPWIPKDLPRGPDVVDAESSSREMPSEKGTQ